MLPEHLVCQHLEQISRDALEKYQGLIKQYVRRRNGIYALYRKNRLYYVSLASDLRTRLKSHLRDRHNNSWDRFSVYLTIGDRHIKELESLLLRIFQPIGNRVKGKFERSQDLRREFARNLSLLHRQERDELLGRIIANDVETPAKKGRRPILATYLRGRQIKLRAHHAGKILKAHVRRDGQISYKGKRFDSPSQAGHTAVKKTFQVNGWTFWEFERAPGDWVLLDELRQ